MATQAERSYALKAVPGFYSTYSGIQIAAQTSDNASDEDLQFMQQLGVEWMMVGVDDLENQNADYYKALKDRFAKYGLQIYRIANRSVHNMPEVTLNLPGRDEKVEEFITFIRNLGRGGYSVQYVCTHGQWDLEFGAHNAARGHGCADARYRECHRALGWSNF